MWGALGLTAATSPVGVIFGLLLTFIVTAFVTGSLNVLIERVGYKPLRNAPKLAPLITAVGFSFVLQNVGILGTGATRSRSPTWCTRATRVFNISGVAVHRRDVLAIGLMIPLVMVPQLVR